MNKRKDEFECLLSIRDLGKYVGSWIVIVNQQIVSAGPVGKEVLKEARKKCPQSAPLLVEVSSDSVMLL